MAIAAKIDNSSLLYIVICSLGVLAFCLVGIYPNVQAMRQLDNDMTKFNAEVQQQEFLYPVYRRLVKEVQQQPPALAMPDKTKLPRKEIPQLGQLFMKLAEKNHLHFDSASRSSRVVC